MPRPDPSEHAPYYGKYVSLVPEEDILAAMSDELARTLDLLRDVPDAEAMRLHPPYTWSIKQVMGHIIDGERIFGYRALRFGRGDATPLPGFDENTYALAGEFDRLPLEDLLAEFRETRRSNVRMFGNFPESAWDRRGLANNSEASVRALAYILVGHERHHAAILRRRLGKG